MLRQGQYQIDFNGYVASGVDPALQLGTVVNLQCWFRDPPEPLTGTGLSGGLQFLIRP